MPGAGPWQDERHRFRRGDKGPTLPPRGYAAPSPSSRGGPGTGSNLRDLTSKDGDVLRARFPAGGSTSNILPKGLPVFRFTSPFPFCTSATGQLPSLGTISRITAWVGSGGSIAARTTINYLPSRSACELKIYVFSGDKTHSLYFAWRAFCIAANTIKSG